MHRVSLDIIQKQLTLGRINQVTVLNVQQAHQHVDGPRTGRDDPACRHRRIVDGSWRRAARRLTTAAWRDCVMKDGSLSSAQASQAK